MEQPAAGIHAGGAKAVVCEFSDLPAVQAQVSTAEHKRRAPLDNGLKQVGVVGDVVFQICILYEQDVTGRDGESVPYRVTLSLGASW
jgi:hypothetical protein